MRCFRLDVLGTTPGWLDLSNGIWLLDVIWLYRGDWNCNMFSLTKTNMKLVIDLAILIFSGVGCQVACGFTKDVF